MRKTAARDWEGMPGKPGGPQWSPNQSVSSPLTDDIRNDVNDFYNTIVLPTKQEFGGIPGVDYDPKYYTKDFMKNMKVFPYSSGLRGGYVSPLDGGVHLWAGLGPGSVGSTFVHEGTHRQNRDTNLFRSGRSPVEDEKLSAAYGFSPADVKEWYPIYARSKAARQEQATINREYRYRIWSDMKKNLGRNPTYDEFKEYIRGMSDDDVVSVFRSPPNAYQDIALARRKDPHDAYVNEKGELYPNYGRLGVYPDSMYSPVRVGFDDRRETITPEQARKTDWYTSNPEVFEPHFRSVENSRDKFPNASFYFSPGDMLDDDLRDKQFDEYNEFLENHPEYSDEDIEAIRRAWLEVARKGGNGQFGKTASFNNQNGRIDMTRYEKGFLTKCAQAGLSDEDVRKLIEENAMTRGAQQYERELRKKRRRDIAKSALGVLLTAAGATGGVYAGRAVGGGHPLLGGAIGAAAGIAGNKYLSTLY